MGMRAVVAAWAAHVAIFGALRAVMPAHADAAEIRVIGSPGVREISNRLVPEFEKATGHKVSIIWDGVNNVAKRVSAGETADLVFLPAAEIGQLIREGKLVGESRVVLATSGVGVAIRAGAPKIDASSSDGIRKALLAAKTIAYSGGPSGVHIAALIQKWGIADKIKLAAVPTGTPVGEVVARGDADIGFQQISELLPVKGIDYLGPLPADIQEVTVFAAALHKAAGAGSTDAARALLKFMTAPEAVPVIRKAGMEPG
jgi:molybdate transport system substrate-binding protein